MTKKNNARVILTLEMLMLGKSERITTRKILEHLEATYGVGVDRKTLYNYMAILGEFYDIDFNQKEGGWLLK